MTRFMSLVVAASLVIGGMTLAGCQPNNANDQPNAQSGGTAGGNGAFGENPAQPGEHSGERFNNSSPTTQPTQ